MLLLLISENLLPETVGGRRRIGDGEPRTDVGLVGIPEVRRVVIPAVQIERHFSNVVGRASRGCLRGTAVDILRQRVRLADTARELAASYLRAACLGGGLKIRVPQAIGQRQIAQRFPGILRIYFIFVPSIVAL